MDFLHMQYTDLMPYWRLSKHVFKLRLHSIFTRLKLLLYLLLAISSKRAEIIFYILSILCSMFLIKSNFFYISSLLY